MTSRVSGGGQQGVCRAAAARGERGVAFVLVTCTVGVLLVVGLGLLMLVRTDLRGAVWERDHVRAFYVAEGGLERAMFIVSGDPSWRDAVSGALGGGQYQVTLADVPPDLVRVTSRGEVSGRVRTVSALVRPAGRTSLDYSLYSADHFIFKYNTAIIGDVHVNGNVQCTANVSIDGCLSLVGSLDDRGNLVATEGVIEGAPAVTEPELDEQWYRDNATVFLSGHQSINGGVYDDDIVFVDGQLDLRGFIQGRVTFVCSGETRIVGNLIRLDSDDPVYVIAAQKVEVTGASLVGAALWSPTKVEVRGNNVVVEGTLVGGNVQCEAKNLAILQQFTFADGLPGMPPASLEVIDWWEGS